MKNTLDYSVDHPQSMSFISALAGLSGLLGLSCLYPFETLRSYGFSGPVILSGCFVLSVTAIVVVSATLATHGRRAPWWRVGLIVDLIWLGIAVFTGRLFGLFLLLLMLLDGNGPNMRN